MKDPNLELTLNSEPICTMAYATLIFDLGQVENVVMELVINQYFMFNA
jgi:hypothetical protein